MDYTDASTALIMAVPEATPGYDRLKDLYGDEEPGPTVVYEGCLKPLLISIAIDGSEADLQRVFGFLESLSNDENWKVRELVRFSVYDLCRNSSALKKAIPFIGPETKKICDLVMREFV